MTDKLNSDKERYQITFNYVFLDEIDNILKAYPIIQKTFTKRVTYLVDIPIEKQELFLNYLISKTYQQVIIKKINCNDDEEQVQGTDKPLGSKSAIDEN